MEEFRFSRYIKFESVSILNMYFYYLVISVKVLDNILK